MKRLCHLEGELSGKTLLCLGAHSDDIEIGCGGTVRKIVQASENLNVHWVVFSAEGVRADEARACADHLLAGARNKVVVTERFRNGFFPYVGSEIKEFFESLKQTCDPDLILTHYRQDLHQDHRVISELTWNTFRNHMILEYEIPKYDGDLSSPNAYVTLSEQEVEDKVTALKTYFKSQHDKQWFAAETFSGLCRIRGIECCSPTGFAEAFYARKIVLN